MTSEPPTVASSDTTELFAAEDLLIASATDIGRVRSVNQDSYGQFDDAVRGYRLLFVADGMGGHRGGEVASQLAVKSVAEVFESSAAQPDDLLRSAFEAANLEIFETASQDPELAGMGTTGVGLILTGESRTWIAHVGDSRAYRLRGGSLIQLTADHSVVGELVQRGQLTPEQARVHPQSNEILRALGTQAGVEVELTDVDIEPGDVFLLCSDGLSGMLPDSRIADALSGKEPEQVAASLVELANEAGGMDNITVQIAVIPSAPEVSTPGGMPSVIRWTLALALFASALYCASRVF